MGGHLSGIGNYILARKKLVLAVASVCITEQKDTARLFVLLPKMDGLYTGLRGDRQMLQYIPAIVPVFSVILQVHYSQLHFIYYT